jgi:hypothetical protein
MSILLGLAFVLCGGYMLTCLHSMARTTFLDKLEFVKQLALGLLVFVLGIFCLMQRDIPPKLPKTQSDIRSAYQ